ncbi:MAG: VF530 family DNA-binding protein [Gammaproteobacteria bacterium]|nr:VF530 family DNA-binding protein [Gammaproteobacteria bacterium]
MSSEINYKNNPLHGLGLKTLVEQIVDHYGFEILYAYLQLNCLKTNPSVASSVKFLKKTEWAREKVEEFYLYQFKNLPKAPAREFSIAPRDRIVPDDHIPGEPAPLSLEEGARLQAIRAKKASAYDRGGCKEKHNNRSSKHTQRGPYARPSGAAPDATALIEPDKYPAASASQQTVGSFDPWAKAKHKLND